MLETPVYDIAVLSGEKAWLAGKTGMLFSDDYGLSWQKIIESPCWQVIATENGIVVADTLGSRGESIVPWRISTDFGESWMAWESTGLKQPPWYCGASKVWEKQGSIIFYPSGDIYRTDNIYIFRSSIQNWNAWTSLGQTDPYYPACLKLLPPSANDSIIYGYCLYVDLHPGGFRTGEIMPVKAGAHWMMTFPQRTFTSVLFQKFSPLNRNFNFSK